MRELFVDYLMTYPTPGAVRRRGSSRRCPVSMVSTAGDMVRSCGFVDLVRCRGLAATAANRAEARRAEALEVTQVQCGVSADIVVVDSGGIVRDVRLQGTVPCIVSKGW